VGCLAGLFLSLLVIPMMAVAPSSLPGSGDSVRIELGADLSVLDLRALYHGLPAHCGYGARLGYRWRDYVSLEGGYYRYVNRDEDDTHSLYLAGASLGIRRGKLATFIKLQPGMIRAARPHHNSPPFTRFAFAAGGEAEAHLRPRLYARLDVDYLIIWFGDTVFGSLPHVARPGTSRYPRIGIGIGFR